MPGRFLLRKRYFRERDGICLETESENRSDLLLCGHGSDSAGRKSPRTRQSQDAFKSRTTLSGSGKALRLSGVVKVQVTIAPDGKIRETKIMGGHPIFVNSVEQTLKDWKYAPAATETTTQMEFTFHP